MEKDRNIKVVAFIALFIAVIGTSVAFASYYETLKIEGSANVKTQSWNVHFENLKKTSNTTAKEVTAPQIQSSTTLISGFEAEFSKPGEVAEYEFDIVNSGSFNSIASEVTINNPTCNGTGDNASSDAENVCKNLTVKLTTSNGTDITNGLALNANSKLEKCKLTITYKATTPKTELPQNDVTVENIFASIMFSQN